MACHTKIGPPKNRSGRTDFGKKTCQKWSPGTLFAAKISPAGPILAAKIGPPLPISVPPVYTAL